MVTHISLSRMSISHCYWHLVVKNGNCTLLLTSNGQQWQFHIATDIQWSRMAISHCYWHLMCNNNEMTSTLVLYIYSLFISFVYNSRSVAFYNILIFVYCCVGVVSSEVWCRMQWFIYLLFFFLSISSVCDSTWLFISIFSFH